MKNLSIIILFIATQVFVIGQEITEKPVIKASDVEAWVSYLASDELKGRANGSPEMELAARWIAARFEEFGIMAFKDYPEYIQEYSFSARGISVDERNVIGYIEGSDPALKDEYIIITAHFDHIGIRAAVDGDSIYNGADDNAAGTATLLGVARAIKISGESPGRSIIFAAVSGEEMGLHGSRYIAANPPVPLNTIYANVNFEMTGHSEELGKGYFYMTGCTYSNLDNLVAEYGKNSTITLIDTIALAERLFYMSDNLSFARIKQEGDILYGIPSSTFATSTFAPHIHKPIDELGLFDLENMADLVNHFSGMVLWLSKCDKPVEWTDNRFRRVK